MKNKAPTHNQRIARWGEQAAAAYLAGKAYEIMGRNVRTPHGEIDIVAQRLDVTVFVEVKTRSSATFGLPEEAVNLRKLEHMTRAAAHYAMKKGIEHWQIDVISVEGKPGRQPVITQFEDVV
jgi:putative endonuclease